MTAPAKTDLAPFPSAGRSRSPSASGGPQPEGGLSVMCNRHTQSVSSIHAPIPPPVYNCAVTADRPPVPIFLAE